MKILKYLILFFILLSTPLWAASPWYINCEDTGSTDQGTFAEPYKDLSNIDGASLTAGDDIYFAQGATCTVSDDIDIVYSGVNAANPSVIGCYEGDADFDCSGTRPIIQNDDDNKDTFNITGQTYIRFEHLDIRNSNADWEDCTPGGDGSSVGIANANGGYITITDCAFYHLGHYAISMQGSYNIVTHNTFSYVGNALYTIANESGTHNYIAHNTGSNIVGYWGCSDSKKVDGHLVGMQGDDTSIIEHNESTNSYRSTYNVYSTGRTSQHLVLRYNKDYSNQGSGLQIAGDGDGTTYHNLVYGNIFTDTSNGGLTRPAIQFISAVPDAKGNRAFNNTIYNAHARGIGSRASAYTYFKNNIVHTAVSLPLFHTSNNPVPPSDLIIDYNLYWSGAGDPSATTVWMDTDIGYYNWTNWTTVRLHDVNSPAPVDPDFTATGSNDFTLQTAQPGGYLTYVSEAGVATTTVNIADSYWFHGDYGLLDEDGNPITGMAITLYDNDNGLQHVTITSDTVTHGTPGSFVVSAAVDYKYDGTSAATKADPTKTTQVSLRHYSATPTIGAEDYGILIDTPSPTSLQSCDADPQAVTISVTSYVDADCNYEDTTCSGETYATLADGAMAGGESGTGAHTQSVNQACDGSTVWCVICRESTTDSIESNAVEITVDVSPDGGGTPQPAPGTVTTGGTVLVDTCDNCGISMY